MSRETLMRHIADAWTLIGQGDRFGIGRRFLIRHGAI